ncbi:unnamed protein product [Withania somnifera]
MNLFFEALRVECGRDIRITLVTPGFVESEMLQGKYIDKTGKLDINPQMRDVKVEDCAKTIVNGACRRERYITVPAWFTFTYLWKVFCLEILVWFMRLYYLTSRGNIEDALSKKILDYVGAQKVVYPKVSGAET